MIELQSKEKEVIMNGIESYVSNYFGNPLKKSPVMYKEDFEKSVKDIPKDQFVSEWERKGEPFILSCINQKDGCYVLKDDGHGYYFIFDMDSKKVISKGDPYYPIFWQKEVSGLVKRYVFFSEYFGYGEQGSIYFK